MQANDDSEKPLRLSKQILQSYIPHSVAIEKIKTIVRDNAQFVLTTHVESDADGIGSQLAFAELLRSLGKKVSIVNCELPPTSFQFLDGWQQIQSVEDIPANELRMLFKSSYVIILDSSEITRSKKVGEYVQHTGCSWMSIDHHDVTEKKENIFSDPSYASTTEFVWDLFHAFQIPISQTVAESLYLGLVSDSGNFRYSKTSPRTHLAAAELLSFSISSEKFYRLLFESYSFDRLPFLQTIFKHAEFDKAHGFVFAQIKPIYRHGLHLGENASEGIVNYFLAVQGVHVAALATKTDEGFLKCSLRSLGDVDVASIAQKFGGGGHKNAAGLFMREKFSIAKRKLKNEIYLYLKNFLQK